MEKIRKRSYAYSRAPFWDRMDKRGPDDCWEWLGSISTHGYGVVGSPCRKAHREALRRHLGLVVIPEDMFVLHRCDNRLCVNPNHLYLGTHCDNMRDMAARSQNVGRPKTLSDYQEALLLYLVWPTSLTKSGCVKDKILLSKAKRFFGVSEHVIRHAMKRRITHGENQKAESSV